MTTHEYEQIDNLLKEVAGGLPYELAKDELNKIADGKYQCGSGNYVKGCIDE